jgi:hypothetical protein
MQTFDSGNAVAQKAPATPTPPRTESVPSLHAELEQRRAEAQAMAEYHEGELRSWQTVYGAVESALNSLKQAPDSQGPVIG